MTESHNGSNTQQQIKNSKTNALERIAALAIGSFNAFTGTKSSP